MSRKYRTKQIWYWNFLIFKFFKKTNNGVFYNVFNFHNFFIRQYYSQWCKN